MSAKKKAHKQPTFAEMVDDRKKARAAFDPETSGNLSPAWRLSGLDWDGPFGWETCTARDAFISFCKRLEALESMSWSEIERGTGSHNVKLEDLCASAQKRLRDLRLEDIDELFSLRIAGAPRAWGFREVNVLRFLWWDPKHEVCPSNAKDN